MRLELSRCRIDSPIIQVAHDGLTTQTSSSTIKMPLLDVYDHDAQSKSVSHNRQDSAFAEPIVLVAENEERSESIIPDESYADCRAFDLSATWTQAQEKAVVRQIDWHLLAFFCLIGVAMTMDRHNLSNALTDGFLDDLHLTSNDYNTGTTVSLIGILASEFPTQFLILRYGYRNVFPWIILAWGTVSWSQAFITGRTSFFVTRFLVGLFEGGFTPGTILFLSEFYTGKELVPRLAIFASVADFSHVVSSLIAAGLLRMRGVLGRPGWFWLFIVEGIGVFLCGVFSLLYLPTSITHTKSILWRRPWFTPQQEVIAVNRTLRDDASKGQKDAHHMPSFGEVVASWRDKAFWGFFLSALIGPIPRGPVKLYLHLNMRRLGFSVFKSNMLAIPAALMQIITVLGLSWSSERFNERTWHCTVAAAFVLPMLIALETMAPGGNPWARWTLATLIVGCPNFGPIQIGWLSASCYSTKKRATLLASNSVLYLVGAIIATQVYQKSDKPYYYRGNIVTITLAVTSCLVIIGQGYFLRSTDKKKARQWDSMSVHEKVVYQDNHEQREKEGNRRLDFRFPY